MERYPEEYLPLPLDKSYEFSTVDPLQTTGLESGRARVRQMWEEVPQTLPVEFIMTKAQGAYFELWHRKRISYGAAWFTLKLETVTGNNYRQVRFYGMYKGPLNLGNDLVRYTAQLEVFEHETLDEKFLDFPQLVTGFSIIDVAVNRDWPKA